MNPISMDHNDVNVTDQNAISMDVSCGSATKRRTPPMLRLFHFIAPAVIFGFALFFPTAARAADYGAEVLAEMNLARTQPQAYAQVVALSARRGREGDRSVKEAVRFLQKAKPLPPLADSGGLRASALAHVLDSGSRGTRGHQGSDGSHTWDRIERYGRWSGLVGENILYGVASPRDAVVALIVDEGVRGRMHRENIFRKNFRLVGIASGPHATAGTVLVTDFAQEFIPAESRLARL
jgi:uncharacterized protein YkwD